jgi:hypothetical protein
MRSVNSGRVIAGGLVAGLIMNISEAALHGGVLGPDVTSLYEALGRTPVASPAALTLLVAATFVLGLTAVWLYAAMRPRFGPGPKTAILAGLAVWACAHLFSGAYLAGGFPGLITPRLAWLPVAWGLVEAPLATLAGAWLYRE